MRMFKLYDRVMIISKDSPTGDNNRAGTIIRVNRKGVLGVPFYYFRSDNDPHVHSWVSQNDLKRLENNDEH